MPLKNNLLKYQTITNGNMASATVTSAVTNIHYMDNIGIQINFTGSPAGTFDVQVSMDYAQDSFGNVTSTGEWTSVNLSQAVSTSGGQPIYIDLNQLSAPWIRLVYTKTSGTGTLNAFITGKTV